MAEFVMPSLGADMREGTLVGWRAQPGELVEKGEIIAEVETDKGLVEVETFTAGTIDRLLAQPGDLVPVGTVLATIREPGGVVDGPPSQAVVAAGQRHPISPAAKRLAGQLGVDVGALAGTGPHGRVLLRDVQAAASATPVQPGNGHPAPPPAPTPPEQPPQGEDAASRMRRSIAAAMARSKREIPHFYVRTTIGMGNAVTWLADENQRRPLTNRLLYGVLLVKAVAVALRDAPDLNARWQDGEPLPCDRINVGVAISLRGGGLIAPALHDADARSLDDLMCGFRDLVSRARNGRLRGSELSEATITVTSLGDRGAEEVYGVIVPPQVAIVGFGSLVERPWLFQGGVLPCPVITATVAGDHRVSDGHRASAFLDGVDRLLQQPGDL